MSATTISTRRSSSHRRLFTTAFLAISLSLTLTTTTTNAQVSYDAPTPVTAPAFGRTSLKLYILSGQPSTANGTLPIGQFFSLDLATPWSANTPAWKRLQPGPKQALFPGTFTADQKTMVVFHIDGESPIYKYSVATDAWAPSPVRFPTPTWQGVGAVTDPSTGLIYLAGGYSDGSQSSMDIYDPSMESTTQSPLPNAATTFAARWYYGNVWSAKRKSVLYFGGYNVTNHPGPATNVVTEFVPNSRSWSTMSTSGNAPALRADHCMASNDDGSKVVVYGGRIPNSPYSGELFILNTDTGVWSQGTSGEPRLYAACTIAGDTFLVWGGVTRGAAADTVASSPVMIYNMVTNLWMQEYVPPASYLASVSASVSATAKPTTTGSGNVTGGGEGGSGSNTGAIVGGIVGGVVVIAAIAGFLFYRRRQQRTTHLHTPVKSSVDNESGSPNNRDMNEEELRRMQSHLENQQQQLEIQRQLLALQQQQALVTSAATAASQPAMVQQYQDPAGTMASSYGYQPALYYPTVPTTFQTVQAIPDTSSSSGYTTGIPAVSGVVGNAAGVEKHSEFYQQTTEPSFAPSPLVYMPADYILPPGTSSPAMSTAVSSGVGMGPGDMSSQYPVSVAGSPLRKEQRKEQASAPQSYVDGAGRWTEKSQPNNPHTILESS